MDEDSSTSVDDSWIDVAATKLKDQLPKSFDAPARKGIIERNLPKVYDPLQKQQQEVAKLAVDYTPIGTVADAIDAYEGGDTADMMSAIFGILPVPAAKPAKLVQRIGDKWKYQQHVVEDVPLEWLQKIYGNNFRYDPADLAAKIQKAGGIDEPLILNVGKISRTAQLGEGNHRREALRQLGYTHAPARVTVGHEWGKGKPQWKGVADDIIPKEGEYFKGEASPSEVFRSLYKELYGE